MSMELPFVGKSSYKKDFSTLCLTDRPIIQRPRDNIKLGNNNTKIYTPHDEISKPQTKVS